MNHLKILLISIVLFSCCTPSQDTSQTETTAKVSQINVALYPYLYEEYSEKSKTVLKELWQKKYPDVALNFVSYNSYKASPPDSVDVFLLDAIYLSSFAEKNWILPIEEDAIDQKEDILPHALAGCLVNEQYYGVPQFGCANILYHRTDDLEIKNAATIQQLYQVIGKATYTSNEPPRGEGLLIDMSSGTTNVCWYVEAAMDRTGKYTEDPKLIAIDSLNQETLDHVIKLALMGSKKQSQEWLPDRPEWYANGAGRGYIGFTENMFQMDPDSLPNFSMRLVPSYPDTDVHLFFMDAVVINSQIEESKKEMATALMNLIASTDHMVQSCRNDNRAFYYMPSRKSIFDQLKGDYPKYAEMYELIQNTDPRTFRLGSDAFDKLGLSDAYKDRVTELIFEPAQAAPPSVD